MRSTWYVLNWSTVFQIALRSMTKYCINHLSTDWGRPGTNERLCILNMFRGCCADLITKIGHSLFLTQSLPFACSSWLPDAYVVDQPWRKCSDSYGGNRGAVPGGNVKYPSPSWRIYVLSCCQTLRLFLFIDIRTKANKLKLIVENMLVFFLIQNTVLSLESCNFYVSKFTQSILTCQPFTNSWRVKTNSPPASTADPSSIP